jgi:DNA polymerase III sliding clamp (beta) subunit (PCNA family)
MEYVYGVDPENTKKILKALKSITNEATISITKDGTKISAIDGSHAVLLNYELKDNGYNGEDVEININTTDLLKAFQNVGAATNLIYEPERKTLIVSHEGSRRKTTFVLPTLESVTPVPKIPPLQYTAHAKLTSVELYKTFDEARTVSDALNISLDENAEEKIIITAINSDGRRYKGSINAGSVSGKANANFRVEILEHALTAAKDFGEFVELDLADNKPLRVLITINEKKGETLEYLVAPVLQ